MTDTTAAYKPEANALVHEIGQTIISSPRIASVDWSYLVMVAVVKNDHASMSGFLYDRSGKSRPASPGGGTILQRVHALRDASRVDGKAPWQACMIRIDRDSGKIKIDFEYEHPENWEITPSNVRVMADRLRPAA